MKFCSEKDLENVIGDTKLNCKVSVMADIGRFDPNSVIPKSESYVDMMRVASYVKDIDKATSPYANFVSPLEVTPPGAAAIIITPNANSNGVFKIFINNKAIIGRTIS